jgi:hypothetical protein
VPEDPTPVIDVTKQTKLENYFKKEKKNKPNDAVTIDPSILISDESEEHMSTDEPNEIDVFKRNNNDNAPEPKRARASQSSQASPQDARRLYKDNISMRLAHSPSPPHSPRDRLPYNEQSRVNIENDPISSDEEEKHVHCNTSWKKHPKRGGESEHYGAESEDYQARFGVFAMKTKKTQATARPGPSSPKQPVWNEKERAQKEKELERDMKERDRLRDRERERDRERALLDSSRDSDVEIVIASPVTKKESQCLANLDLSCLLADEPCIFVCIHELERLFKTIYLCIYLIYYLLFSISLLFLFVCCILPLLFSLLLAFIHT